MGKWHVYYRHEIADRKHADFDRAQPKPLHAAGNTPDRLVVDADRLVVEGGALVFYLHGEIDCVIGPTVYASVYRQE